MSLHDKILKLLQDSNSVSYPPILSHINLDDCLEIDELSKTDNFIRQKRSEMLNQIKTTLIDSFDKQKNVFNIISKFRLTGS
jgi:hypothetical protein